MAITQRYIPGKLFGTTTIKTTKIETPAQAKAMLTRRGRSRARTRDAFEAMNAKAAKGGIDAVVVKKESALPGENVYRKAKFSFDDEKPSFAVQRFIFPIVIGTLIVIALCAVIASGVADNSKYSDVYELPRLEVVVEQGDTLESVAAEHSIDGFSDVELSRVIANINMETKDSPLMPGEVIWVPSMM